MTAGRLKWVGEVMKDGLAVMVNHGGLPVHQAFGMNDFASERHGKGLMPETDSQDRDSPGELTDCRHRYSGLFGRTGARRNHQLLRVQGFDLIDRDPVVSIHL